MLGRLLLALLLFAPLAHAQATYNAAGCSQAQIAAAISTEQASKVDGDIIAIPAGTCTWTGTQAISQTFTNSVTIQGAGAISATTGGTSTTGTDQTVIIDNTSASQGSLLIFNTAAGKSFRFTGISLQGNGSSTQESNGILNITGLSTAVRLDHNHFVIPNATSQGPKATGGVEGVADHNYFNSNNGDLTFNMSVDNGSNWNGAADGIGNASWADSDNWGSSKFFFVEDNRFFDGGIGETNNSGRVVFRHNTVTGTAGSSGTSSLQWYWHGLQTGVGRGGRAGEFYLNTFTSNGNNGNPPVTLNSGTALVWGNAVTGGYQNTIQISYNFRNLAGGGGNYTYPPPPAGWGFCGSAAGGPTAWDGNHSTVTGYPCLGQPGRGQGQLLNGTSFATLVNSTTGTVAWPHEALSPIYVWDNTYNPQFYNNPAVLIGNNCAGSSSSICTENTDFYQQFGNGGRTGTFNGTVGIGQGLLSARPTTCTAGTDPQTGASAPGVGYWATDTTTLYVCNPTNTWTTYYTPYTYPHPLTGGGGSTTVTIPKSFFGMTQQLPTNPLFSATLPNTGIVRLWNTTCTWNAVNTAASTFTYATPCDAQIAVATNIGAQPDFVFGRTPAWAITGGAPNCTGVFAGGSGGCAQPPADNDTGGATLIAMVNSLVSHLASTHPGVHWIFECVNEAEFASEWSGTMTQLVTYCTTLRNAAHAADPQIIVLGPSAATFSTFNVHLYTDPSFNYATQAGAAASLDAINIHDYLQTCSTFCKVPESIVAAMVSVNSLTTAGQPLAGKPVYFTEGDWGGGGNSASMTDAQKRQYLTRNYLYFLWQNANTTSQTNVMSKIWYAWDSTPDNQSTSFGGLCVGSPPSSCTPNQAATAMANLEKWLVGATYTTPSTTAMSEDGNGTWTLNLLSSPVSTGSAEIIFNATATPSVPVSSAYKTVINWDGSTTPIVGNAVTAGPDPVIAVISGPIPGSSTGGSHAVTSGITVPDTSAISSRLWAPGPMHGYLPVATVNVTFPNTSGYTTLTPASITDLRNDITTAAAGCDNGGSSGATGYIISIPQGSVYTSSVATGVAVLPVSTCTTSWIVITTAGLSFTRGTRVDPSTVVGTFAKLSDTAANGNVITCTANVPCGRYWFLGVEIECNSGANGCYGVAIPNSLTDTPADLPHDIVLDHVYIHAHASDGAVHGWYGGGNNLAVVDSWMSDWHQPGGDAQAINWDAGGPLFIQNDFLEGAGENILFGGGNLGGVSNTYAVNPHDLTAVHSWFYKPLQWNVFGTSPVYEGILWDIKNLIEFKMCVRCLIQYNVLQNNWFGGQLGADAVHNGATSQDGRHGIQSDIVYDHNHFIGGASWYEANSVDAGNNQQTNNYRMEFSNNLFEDTGANWASSNPLTKHAYTYGALINHNTSTATNPASAVEVNSIFNRVALYYFSNNIVQHGANGFQINGFANDSIPNLNVALGAVQGPTIINNAIQGMPSGTLTTWNSDPTGNWAGNSAPVAMSNIGFVNAAGAGGDYRLCTGVNTPSASCAAASPYLAGGANGCQVNANGTGGNANCGADIPTILTQTAGIQTVPSLWPDFLSGGGISISPTSLTCNGSNTFTITPVAGSNGGSQFVQAGLDVLFRTAPITPTASSTSSLTITPPTVSGAIGPITQTGLTSNLAKYTVVNTVQNGDVVTITGTTNGGGFFNMTGVVSSRSGTAFNISVNHANITTAADTGSGTSAFPITVSNFGMPLTGLVTCN